MFDGKLVANEQVGVLLSIVQVDHNHIAVYLLQYSAKQKGFPYVGCFVLLVCVKIHHVATTEVRKEVIALLWHFKSNAIVAAMVCTAFLFRNR